MPHALNEQAKHVAHILQAARDRGTPTVEPTAQAEEDYVQEIAKSANVGARFYAECTPGYYNSEGKRGTAAASFRYAQRGRNKVFKLLKDWRDEGSLEGLDLRTAPLRSYEVASLEPDVQALAGNDVYRAFVHETAL